ncbi:MAG: hypothetical protein ACM33B_11855 [Pseudomonadota bacterium]
MAAAELTRPTEGERVQAWRLEELERAGYPRELAAEIAGRLEIDLHHAVALVREQGCAPDIAARILL